MGDDKEEDKGENKNKKTEAALEICEIAYKQYTREKKKIWEPVWPGPTQSRRHPVRITLKMCGGQGCVICGVPEDAEGRPEGFVWRSRYLPLKPVAPKPPERWSGWRLRKKRPKKKRGKRHKPLDDLKEALGTKKGHYSKDSDDEEERKALGSFGRESDAKKLRQAREETLREIYKKGKKKKSKKDKILEDEMLMGYLGRVCDITCLRKRIPRPRGRPVAGVTCQDVGTMTCLLGEAFSESHERPEAEKICSYRDSETCRIKRIQKSKADHLRHRSNSSVNFREEYGETNYYEPLEKQTYVFAGAKDEEEWDSSPIYPEIYGEHLECVPSVCPKYPRGRGSHSADRTREICAEPCRIQYPRGRSSGLKSTPQKRPNREKTVRKGRSRGEMKNTKIGKPCRTCQREGGSKRSVTLVKTTRQEGSKKPPQICETCQRGRFESRRIENVLSRRPNVCETCKRKIFESQRILRPPPVCESCLRKRSPVKDLPVEELPVEELQVEELPIQELPEKRHSSENLVPPRVCDTCQRKTFESQRNKIVILKPPQVCKRYQSPRKESKSGRQERNVKIVCKEKPPRDLKPQKSVRLSVKGEVPCCTCPPPSRPPSARKRKHKKKKHRKVKKRNYHEDCVPPDKVNPYVDPTESSRSCRPC